LKALLRGCCRLEYVAAPHRDETIQRSDETIFGSTRRNRETVTPY
jgi:hypothetical protein